MFFLTFSHVTKKNIHLTFFLLLSSSTRIFFACSWFRYAFIPDGSFVGTAFVNATSNILSTAARQVTAKVSGLCDLTHVTTPGNTNTKASWGLQIPLGSVMFGQSKDLIVSVPSELFESIAASVRVDVDYMTSGGLEKQIAFTEGIERVDDVEALVQGIRVRTVDLLRVLLKLPNRTVGAKKVAEISAHIKSVSTVLNEGDARVADIVKDLDGQISEALSRDDWYTKWGRHYIPSLAIAHSLQQCHNFKDPGVSFIGYFFLSFFCFSASYFLLSKSKC